MPDKKKAASLETQNKKQISYIKKFIKQVIKIVSIFFIIFTFILICFVGGTVIGIIKSSEPLASEDLLLKGFTSKVYDSNDRLIMELAADKNREMVDSKNIPQNLKYAFIAIEDKRFYSHHGIDYIRIINAVFNYFLSGSGKHGASTITQQVVKNLTGQTEKSFKRKIEEQWRALELEKMLSKDQILEIYLNLIYMGENCYGVQASSKTYFNKDVSKLTLAECACLAGITNLPEKYIPFTPEGKESNLKRQKIILYEMLNCGFIKKKEYDAAIQEEVKFSDPSKRAARVPTTQPYFIDQVVLDVKKDLMAKGYSEKLAIKTIYNNGLKIYTTMDLDIQNAMDQVFTNSTNFSIVNKSAGQPQGSMVILDPKNGHIKAIYGGFGPKKGNTFNRATSIDMQRQPGSTFKPIAVYGPAINERLITPGTVIDDVPVYMFGQNKDRYPENYNHSYRGLTNIHDAIRDSINVVAAKVWMKKLGPDLSIKYLKKVGINRPDEKYVSIALGGLNKGVNPLQMAAAFAPFAYKGIYHEPVTYLKVEDSQGNVLIDKEIISSIAYDEGTAFIMTNMMQSVVRLGTAYPYGMLQNGNMPTAGKTGTTSDNHDKWFAGYSPYYVGVTWYGYDTQTQLLGSEYNRALKIWHDVMEKAHIKLNPKEFSLPSNLVKKTICIYSGKLAKPLCYKDPRNNSIREEYFLTGTEPTKDCDVHVSCQVCTASHDEFGRAPLKGLFCPASTVIEGIFISRTEPFVPVNSSDPYPQDWKYELVSKTCTVHNNDTSKESLKPMIDPNSFEQNNNTTIIKSTESENNITGTNNLTKGSNTFPNKDNTLKNESTGINDDPNIF